VTALRTDGTVPLAPGAARRLWTDTGRWATFVEGFARVVERRGEWPAEGATVVWQSIPQGRGRVTERVVQSAPDRLTTEIFEERLTGTQLVTFAEDVDGAYVRLELDYQLTRGGPLRRLVDALFIRRAVRDMLVRTLRRFAIEAEEEAGLDRPDAGRG
jgi:Polyketide cyclase / dehydrase and lipid transport